MLFDLRGRRRRRVVQVIYVTLAVLMGGGLVFFGIGGSVSGGLFDAFGGGSGSAGTSAEELLRKQEDRAERTVRLRPRDERAWVALVRVRYQLAGQGDNYDQQTGTFKPDGRRELARAAQAWDRYMALNPRRPDPTLARLMLQAFGPGALNQPKQGVQAAEIVVEASPSSQTFFVLAQFAFAAKQDRKGQLAGERAVELAPPSQRAQVRALVSQAKSQGGFGRQPSQGAPPTAAGGGGGGQQLPEGNEPTPRLPPGATG